MSDYTKLVLAVDLTEESNVVAQRALAIARDSQAIIHLVHVIEPLGLTYGGDLPMDVSAVQNQIQEQAAAHLKEFGRRLDISESEQHLIFGRPESEIQKAAEEIGADLIVVGSHGRHGLALLLGSTANGVLHGATCDVLAVRVGTIPSNEKIDSA